MAKTTCEVSSNMFYRLVQVLFRIYFLLFHRLRVRGMEELERFLASLPADGSVILASNHASYLDPPAVGTVFPRTLRFIAWDGLFRVPLFATLIRTLGAVPVSPENKNSAAGLLRQVMGFLESGHSVLIFPEGERTPDGKMRPLEGGVALIALKTGAPIVPVWLEGTWRAFPPHLRFPRPYRITLTFGKPLLPGALPKELTERQKRDRLLADLKHSLETMRDAA